MNIEFTTDKIDKKLYEQLILFYIYEHYNYKDHKRLLKQDKWEIVIKKTSDYDVSFYSNDPRAEELDFSIPDGVTMKEKIICYIEDNKNSFASYGQLVVKPIQGLHLLAKYDYFDHDYDQQTGSISRFSYGLEFYPLNMLEIKFQAREYSGENNDLSLNPEYLIQIHTWF